MKCHVCESTIEGHSKLHRGLLINKMATLAAGLLTCKDMLRALKARKSPNVAQRNVDFAAIMNLEARIINDELCLSNLKKENEECYG